MNSQHNIVSVEKLERDLKRMLRIQFKEFLHFIEENEFQNMTAAARLRLASNNIASRAASAQRVA